MESLARSPVVLSRQEKWTAALLTILAGWTRWPALARTMWDWDEAQFMLALRHYDVALHHPHPPGFPLFIVAAKLFTLLGFTEFHSLQAVTFIAACAIFPIMFFLGRELRAGVPVSMGAAVLLTCFPNVWFYGGTAFSDIPSLALVMLSMGLLLAGCRNRQSMLAGAIVAAISIGFRPQNLLIVLLPAILAAWFQWREKRRSLVILSVGIAAGIVLASYGSAVALTGGWDVYRTSIISHEQYISATDSFRSPARPPLLNMVDDFFIRPYHAPLINTVIISLAFLSLLSLIRRRLHVMLAVGSFVPFCVLAWLLLDRFSASRFSLGYAPLLALLAAEGAANLSRRKAALEAGVIAAVAGLMMTWSWPAIREVHAHPSPPVAAANWISQNVSRRSSIVFVEERMLPYGEVLLPGYSVKPVTGPWPPSRRGGVFVKEGSWTGQGAMVFARERGPLYDIARQRYFEVSVIPLRSAPEFGAGWYDEESSARGTWRWMGRRSSTLLPAVGGAARLQLRVFVPLDSLASRPVIVIRLNGVLVDQFVASTAILERSYDVHSRSQTSNELTLDTGQVVNPAADHLGGDTRDLGLRLDSIVWTKL